MIHGAVIDCAGSIKLFQEEEMGKIVGGSHGREGKAEVGSVFELFRQAVGAAQNEGDVPSLVFKGFDPSRELFRRQFWSYCVENNDDVAFQDCRFDFRGVGDHFIRQHYELFQSQTKIIPNLGKRTLGEGTDGNKGDFEHNGQS